MGYKNRQKITKSKHNINKNKDEKLRQPSITYGGKVRRVSLDQVLGQKK